MKEKQQPVYPRVDIIGIEFSKNAGFYCPLECRFYGMNLNGTRDNCLLFDKWLKTKGGDHVMHHSHWRGDRCRECKDREITK
jgi:hypothetical protein